MNEEQILAQAEQIARKAQTQGYESLTEEEKRILQMAQQIMQQYDMSSQGGGAPVEEDAGYGAPEAGVPAGGAPEMPVGGNEYANGGKMDRVKNYVRKAGYNTGVYEVNDSIKGGHWTPNIDASRYEKDEDYKGNEWTEGYAEGVRNRTKEVNKNSTSNLNKGSNKKTVNTNKKSYGGSISIDKSELGAPFLKTKDASYYFL